jgi:hypothetical protein
MEETLAHARQLLSSSPVSLPQPQEVRVDSSLPVGYREVRTERDRRRVANSLKKRRMSLPEAAAVLNLPAHQILTLRAEGKLKRDDVFSKERNRWLYRVTTASVRKVMRQRKDRALAAQAQNLSPSDLLQQGTMNAREAALCLGVKKNQIYVLVQKGVLEARRAEGNRLEIETSSVSNLLNSSKNQGS